MNCVNIRMHGATIETVLGYLQQHKGNMFYEFTTPFNWRLKNNFHMHCAF